MIKDLYYVIDDLLNVKFSGTRDECIDFIGMNIKGYGMVSGEDIDQFYDFNEF